MLDRSRLRLLLAGSLVATGLLGGIAASHAQASFWQHLRDGAHLPRVGSGLEVASMRTESRDHVRAQIERMEARARADDRLSGRPADAGRPDDRTSRQPERQSQTEAQNTTEVRPTGVGPGWQARGRDGGR